MSPILESEPSVSHAPITMRVPNRVVATIQPQVLRNNMRVDQGAPSKIDITHLVVRRSAKELQLIQDNHRSSDLLVPYSLHFHDGLYKIEVEQSLCEFFGIPHARHISQEMVDAARNQYQQTSENPLLKISNSPVNDSVKNPGYAHSRYFSR